MCPDTVYGTSTNCFLLSPLLTSRGALITSLTFVISHVLGRVTRVESVGTKLLSFFSTRLRFLTHLSYVPSGRPGNKRTPENLCVPVLRPLKRGSHCLLPRTPSLLLRRGRPEGGGRTGTTGREKKERERWWWRSGNRERRGDIESKYYPKVLSKTNPFTKGRLLSLLFLTFSYVLSGKGSEDIPYERHRKGLYGRRGRRRTDKRDDQFLDKSLTTEEDLRKDLESGTPTRSIIKNWRTKGVKRNK